MHLNSIWIFEDCLSSITQYPSPSPQSPSLQLPINIAMTASFDLINWLPNSLLSTIISFLPFKEAVRTCVLSKNWLNICKSTTNIEFNEFFFVKPDEPTEIRKAQRKAFLDFTTFWIANHTGTSVDKFCLTLSMPQNVGDVIERCIAFATQHGVKELELDFSDPNWNRNNAHYDNHEALFKLPAHVYLYTRLESLKLYSCSFVETKMVNFHALKQVYLGWMEMILVAIKALLMNCKMLESLSMERCCNFDAFDLEEEQNTRLKKLVLDKCVFLFDFFKVNAPNLKIFKYCGLMKFFIIEILSLEMEEADLDFSPEYGFKGHGPFLYDLLEHFYSVRVLTVCSYLLQVIPSGGEPLLMQQNMNVRHLIMKTALHENDFLGITFLLNSCPMLEYLTIELCSEKVLPDYEPPFNFNCARFWIDNVGAYKCLSSSLRVVEIKGFKGTRNELLVLNYFIISGEVLKSISINILKDNNDDNNNIDMDEDNTNDSHYVEKGESSRLKKANILLNIPKVSSELDISIY